MLKWNEGDVDLTMSALYGIEEQTALSRDFLLSWAFGRMKPWQQPCTRTLAPPPPHLFSTI
jgi:hypothetical protein